MVPPLGTSIYLWMYSEGLKHTDLVDVLTDLAAAGHNVRDKDIRNYWNGWINSDRNRNNAFSLFNVQERTSRFQESKLSDYPMHPYLGLPELDDRWVACNSECIPLYKYSEIRKTRENASCMVGCKVLGENMLATKMIVIDIDGDHDKTGIDIELIRHFSRYISITHTLQKPKPVRMYGDLPFGAEDIANVSASFHLCFATDRVIPTMHFPVAHIDLLGNRTNQLRFWKNKVWNGLEPVMLTDEVWEDLKKYICMQERKINANSVRVGNA